MKLWNTDTLVTWYRNSVTGNLPVHLSKFFKSVHAYFLAHMCCSIIHVNHYTFSCDQKQV